MFNFLVSNNMYQIICICAGPLLQNLPLDGEFAWPIICFDIIWKEMHSTRYILKQKNANTLLLYFPFLVNLPYIIASLYTSYGTKRLCRWCGSCSDIHFDTSFIYLQSILVESWRLFCSEWNAGVVRHAYLIKLAYWVIVQVWLTEPAIWNLNHGVSMAR